MKGTLPWGLRVCGSVGRQYVCVGRVMQAAQVLWVCPAAQVLVLSLGWELHSSWWRRQLAARPLPPRCPQSWQRSQLRRGFPWCKTWRSPFNRAMQDEPLGNAQKLTSGGWQVHLLLYTEITRTEIRSERENTKILHVHVGPFLILQQITFPKMSENTAAWIRDLFYFNFKQTTIKTGFIITNPENIFNNQIIAKR